ncbi:MAG TPA: hypothetical protein VMR14_20930 [Streptosporangiaceae bacterium]|jgi:hypothetical protein|nr:hypothetical protein [Streptosporangiaceae bacterium]
MGMARGCQQCGTSFIPRREHARFCSAECRIAWNRENKADPAADVSALTWSITAMRDATERIGHARAFDQARAFAVVSEAVWWVTIVDATLVRYHPDSYDQVLSEQPAGERPLIEDTLGGLRFVRNQMSPGADQFGFIRPAADQPHQGDGRVAAWTWNQLTEPSCESLSPDGKQWELGRYRAYQTRLAGHPVGETFGRASAFLDLAAAQAARLAENLSR